MMKNIFRKSVRRLYGGADLDGVSFNYEFRLRWLPFDVCHRKEDKDSFPFILFEENGNEKVARGGHDDSYEDIMVANAVETESVVLKGRGWSDAHCMVVDQKRVSVNTLLAMQLSMRDDHGIDISTWKVYNPLAKSVVPEDIYKKTMRKLIKSIRRIIALYEKVLVDEGGFSDYLMKCSDSVGIKKMKKRILESIREYELSYRCGLLSESEEEYADIKEKLHLLNKKIPNVQNEYRIGDKIVFFTSEIAKHASVMAGTAISTCLNDYSREEVVGTITQIHHKDSEPISYVIFEESGYLCSMVQPEDIVGIVSNE